MFCNYFVLKLLRLETITFSDGTLSNINVVLCYVLSQYHMIVGSWRFSFFAALFVLPGELHRLHGAHILPLQSQLWAQESDRINTLTHIPYLHLKVKCKMTKEGGCEWYQLIAL
jgi:hypothetical protein